MGLEYEYFKKYIQKLGFDIDIEAYEQLKEAVEHYAEKNDINGLEYYMKYIQNCGGYALQIPICIFSGVKYSFEEQVLRILELYPFVRLLSDTELKENEYIVKFRSGKAGHHFMKIDENGNATDKHECNLPGKFQGWRDLEHNLEAVFAVVKQEYRSDNIKDLPQCNRDIFLNEDAYYVIEEDGYKDIRKREATKPLTFNDILQEAYKKQKSSFIYNNKTFYLKINNNDSEIIYICNESQILGQFYTDGDDFIIELDDKKKNNIFGFQPSKPIQIRKEHEKDEFDYR